MKNNIFFIKEGPKEVDFDMEKVFLRNESVDIISTSSDNFKNFLDEKLLKLDNILKERHGELINCLKDVELRVERVEKEMLDGGLKLVQRDFITSDSKDFEKKSSEIDDSFSKKEDNLPNISIGQEELDALLEGINYIPKENEDVQHDVKFNTDKADKDLNLASSLHVTDNFSNDFIKKESKESKESIDVVNDNVSVENMEVNNNNDHSEKLDSFVDNKQHLDLIDENGNVKHGGGSDDTILECSGERLEFKEFDDFENILKEDLDSQITEGSLSNYGEKNLNDNLGDEVDRNQSNDVSNCEKPSFQNITEEDPSFSHFNFNDVEKVVSKFNTKESLSNVALNSDEKAVLINFIDRIESELELNPNRNIFKIKQEYEVLKKVKFLLTKN